jgi:hypothetical protein
MKLINKILVVAVTTVAFTAVNRVGADDTGVGSPKARELAASFRKVPGTTTDMLDRSIKVGSPKAVEMAASLRKVRGTTVDRLDRSYAGIPKLREQFGPAAKEFQVAPLK